MNSKKRIFLIFGSALLLNTGCIQTVQTIRFPISLETPAAEVQAKISRDKNNNTKIKLTVKHLAPPENLYPPKAAYVVWIQSEDRLVNLGQLRVDKRLKGTFDGVTPLKEFRIFITAENNYAVVKPSSLVVLETETFRVELTR